MAFIDYAAYFLTLLAFIVMVVSLFLRSSWLKKFKHAKEANSTNVDSILKKLKLYGKIAGISFLVMCLVPAIWFIYAFVTAETCC